MIYRRVLTLNELFLPQLTQDTFFPWATAPTQRLSTPSQVCFTLLLPAGHSTNSTQPSPGQAQQLLGAGRGLWTRVPHKPSSAGVGMELNKALNAEAARASLAVHCPETLSGNRSAKLSPISYGIAQGHHLDRKDWAWLKWKDSSEASIYWNGSFVMSQPQMLPSSTQEQESQNCRTSPTAAARATLEQWELNNKTWLYSKSWWDLLICILKSSHVINMK